MTSQDYLNKVPLESGRGAISQLTGISHTEARNMNREDTKNEVGRDLEIFADSDLGSMERRTAGHSSAASLIYQVFIPVSDSRVFIVNRRT